MSPRPGQSTGRAAVPATWLGHATAFGVEAGVVLLGALLWSPFFDTPFWDDGSYLLPTPSLRKQYATLPGGRALTVAVVTPAEQQRR